MEAKHLPKFSDINMAHFHHIIFPLLLIDITKAQLQNSLESNFFSLEHNLYNMSLIIDGIALVTGAGKSFLVDSITLSDHLKN